MIKTPRAKETAAVPTSTGAANAKPPAGPKRPTPRVKAAAVKPKTGSTQAAVATATVPAAKKTSILKAASKQPATVHADASPAVLQTKVKAQKLVSDRFTFLEVEYKVLGDLKKSCINSGVAVKKNELLRVGIGLIKSLNLAALKGALAALPPLKAERAKKDK